MKASVQLVAVFTVCLILCSCLNINSMSSRIEGEPAGGSVKSELYFGLDKPDGTSLTEAEWQDFLDKSVTPRFPDGLTVFDSYGQYKNSNGKITKGKSKVLIIVHKPGRSTDLEKICEEYKKAFSQEMVFRTSARVNSSLDAPADDNGVSGNE